MKDKPNKKQQQKNFTHKYQEKFRVVPMHTIPALGNGKSCLGPVFLTIYEFGSIQFSNTLMSDGYFHIFLKKQSN